MVRLDRALRTPREIRKKLEGQMSKSTLSKFAKDAVDCPVLEKMVSFLVCFACPNYVRRYKGVVHCRGEPLTGFP